MAGRGVVPHEVYIGEANVAELLQYHFVFLCMDSGPAKRLIIETLHASGRSFIDTGIGVELLPAKLQLWSICRVTTSTGAQHDHVAQGVSCVANEDDVRDKQRYYRQRRQVQSTQAPAPSAVPVPAPPTRPESEHHPRGWRRILGWF